jgi:hypothetical protein
MKEEARPNRKHKSIGYAFVMRSPFHIFSLIQFDRQEKKGSAFYSIYAPASLTSYAAVKRDAPSRCVDSDRAPLAKGQDTRPADACT